jgi:glycosyltransferase involved in cell wall biosynthesis
LLAAQRPQVVHFHAFTPAVSVLWLEAARALGIACVYTYHTPTLACGRGTLLRWGRVPCDGRLTPWRCAACTLHGLGMGKAVACGLAALSPLTAPLFSKVPFRIWPLIRQRSVAVRCWLGGMQRVVALSAWSRAVMERNGVPAAKLRLVRHGLAAGGQTERRGDAEMSGCGDGARLRLGFFGRVDRAKGLALLAQVLRLRPDLAVELHCHLVGESSAERKLRVLVDEMRADDRVRIHPPAPPERVIDLMAGYDAVLVPSQGFETGPLVVLEAFAAGVPVIGSDLGGIAEWVTQGLNGLLCPPGDAEAWALALDGLSKNADLRVRLRAGVKPPPAMTEVAARMVEIYQEAMNEAA